MRVNRTRYINSTRGVLILHSRQQSPGEIKRWEVSWTHKEVSPEEIKSREVELGLRAGLLLLQLFPNGGATPDIVFVTLFCIAVGTAITWCGGRCAVPDAGHFCCSGGGPRQPWSSGLAPVSRCHSSVPLFLLVPLPFVGLLASADVKQQKLIRSRPL